MRAEGNPPPSPMLQKPPADEDSLRTHSHYTEDYAKNAQEPSPAHTHTHTTHPLDEGI